MRRAIIGLWLTLAGCGQLENAPFLPGVVAGQLDGFDPAVALVAVKDGGTVSPDADGSFRITVPAGAHALYVVANAGQGALLSVRPNGEAHQELGRLATSKLGAIDLDFSAAGAGGVRVEVEGFPVPVSTSEPDELRLGRLPGGCYHLVVSVPGAAVRTVDPCLHPGEDLDLAWPALTPHDAGVFGCQLTGCEGSLLCNHASGECEP